MIFPTTSVFCINSSILSKKCHGYNFFHFINIIFYPSYKPNLFYFYFLSFNTECQETNWGLTVGGQCLNIILIILEHWIFMLLILIKINKSNWRNRQFLKTHKTFFFFFTINKYILSVAIIWLDLYFRNYYNYRKYYK